MLQLISACTNDLIRKEASMTSSCAKHSAARVLHTTQQTFLAVNELGLLYLADYKEIRCSPLVILHLVNFYMEHH